MKLQRHTTLTLICCLVAVMTFPARADEAAGEVIPDYVTMVLQWLPVDTETLIVSSHYEKNKQQPGIGIAHSMASSPVLKQLDDLIRDCPVLWAVHGGRNFDVISAFGTVRQEGVSVIRLAAPVAKEQLSSMSQTLRQQASETRKMFGHEVFVFPPLKQDAKVRPWESYGVILLDASTMVKSSSAPYLEEFLKRMQGEVSDRALPADLPEWKYVHPLVDAWLLRHVPATSRQRKRVALKGLVWKTDASGFQSVYLPMEGQSVEGVARIPCIDRETNQIPPVLEPMLVFQKADDGSVTFNFRSFKPGDDETELAKQVQAIQDSQEKIKFAVFSMSYIYSSQGIVH